MQKLIELCIVVLVLLYIWKMNFFVIIILFALIAEIAWTIAGFWSSSIFLPLVSNILDFKNALILVAIYHIFGNASRLSMFYKHINIKILILFGIPSIICTIIGAMLVSYIDQVILKMILWIVLILFSTYSLLHPTLKVSSMKFFWILWWWLSGFTAWLIGTWGVLRGAFMSMFQLPKEQYIATIATVALIVDATRIPIYFGNGFLESKFWFLIPILFCTAFIGSFIGKKIITLLPDALFRKIILIGIMVLSSIFVYQWIQYLI